MIAEARHSSRDELVASLIGVWMLAGAGLDAWAHVRDSSLETFFTPWHGVLYSGFAAMIAWTVRAGLREDVRAIRVSVIGLVVFGIGGVGDLLWHAAFGVERELSAVTSPTHIVLFLGAALILSSPLRAAWARAERAPSWRAFFPTFLSATSVGALTMLLFFYVSPFLPRGAAGGQLLACADAGCRSLAGSYSIQQQMLTSIMVTNLLVFGPLLVLLRRWKLPPLSICPAIAIVACAPLAVVGFTEVQPVLIAAGGAAAVEVVHLLVGPRPDRPQRIRLFGALGCAAFWTVSILWTRVAYGVPWPPELLAGSVVWTSVAGGAMAVMVTLRMPSDPS